MAVSNTTEMPSTNEAQRSSATILVPIDESEESSAAVPLAAWLARGLGAELVLMTVGKPAETKEDVAEERWQLGHLLAKQLPDLADIKVREHVDMSGDPVSGILRVADEEGADMIVMATHGRSGLRRFLNHNLSQEVVEHAKIPVTLVRAS